MRKDEEKPPVTLETLTQRLDEVKRLQPESSAPKKLSGDAARSAIDFASATAVGTVLGYGFDTWQETTPWGLLVGLLIGTAAGLKLMFAEEARAAKRATRAAKTDND
ncbi:MAG: AtpZ/AtpI family protein [Alphaproteobacteria bacterium]|nr:AtpZ/AtpI family protein [Alphaproteobacteria bacterium]